MESCGKRSFQGALIEVREIFAPAVRPGRSIAFEKFAPSEAVKRFPELRGVYAQLTEREQLIAQSSGNDRAVAHFKIQLRAETQRLLDTGQVPAQAAERTPAAREQVQQPASAKAFQAVGEQRLSRDDALKFHPELRHAFNELAVAKVRHANDPQQYAAARASLQKELDAGRVPTDARSAPTRTGQFSLQR